MLTTRPPNHTHPRRDLVSRTQRWQTAGIALLILLPCNARAEPALPNGLFITVSSPITGEVKEQLVEASDGAIHRFRAAEERDRPLAERRFFKVVFDFNPKNSRNSSADYGACRQLADHIQKLANATTIAYVHNEVTGHAVLPVLACREIIFSSEGSLGDVLRDQRRPVLEPDQELFYTQLLRGRPNPARILDRLRKDTLYTAEEAREQGLCQKEFRASREEVARAYELPIEILREDPLINGSPNVWRIEVNGRVNKALQESVLRRVQQAVRGGANHLILQLQCGDGDPQAAWDLAVALANRNDQGQHLIMTTAYIPSAAPDTAAILALGCTDIVMHKDASFGDFTSFLYESSKHGLVEVSRSERIDLARKALADLLARKPYYDPLLARGLTEPGLNLYLVTGVKEGDRRLVTEEDLEQDRKQKSPRWDFNSRRAIPRTGGPRGNLLVLDAGLAQELGVARHVVDGLPYLYAKYGIPQDRVHAARTDWLDEFADFLQRPIVSIVLVMLGIMCLILEFKLPGVSLPGIVSALCFVLFFWAHSKLAGSVAWLAALLFILGLLLIILEVFVLPGFGAPGVCGILLVIGSLILVIVNSQQQSTHESWGIEMTLAAFGVGLVGSIVGALVLAAYLPHIPFANRLVLKPHGEQTDDLDEEASDLIPTALTALLGAIGVAATPLRPAGKVQFGDDFIDVVAEGSYVMPGSRVQVVEIEGNRVVVKEV